MTEKDKTDGEFEKIKEELSDKYHKIIMETYAEHGGSECLVRALTSAACANYYAHMISVAKIFGKKKAYNIILETSSQILKEMEEEDSV